MAGAVTGLLSRCYNLQGKIEGIRRTKPKYSVLESSRLNYYYKLEPAGAGLYKNTNRIVKRLQAEKTGTIHLWGACIIAAL